MRNKRNPVNTKFDAHEVENYVFCEKAVIWKFYLNTTWYTPKIDRIKVGEYIWG